MIRLSGHPLVTQRPMLENVPHGDQLGASRRNYGLESESIPTGNGVPIMSLVIDAVYLVLLVAISPWLVWQSLRTGKYRQGLPAKLFGLVPRRDSTKPCVWLHAVSVGEVNLLVPLVAEIGRLWPDWDCVISTTTRTGFALAQSRFADHTVFYCPLDFSWAVRRAMRWIRPRLLVLAELELWPNLIRFAQASGARVAIVNGRLSERSFRGYRRIRPLVAPVMRRLDLVAVQTPEYAERFLASFAAVTPGRACHRFNKVRRRRKRSRKSANRAIGPPGRHRARRRRVFGRQHAGAGRTTGAGHLSPLYQSSLHQSRRRRKISAAQIDPRAAPSRAVRSRGPIARWQRLAPGAAGRSQLDEEPNRAILASACCWSIGSANCGPGGVRPQSPLSAAV